MPDSNKRNDDAVRAVSDIGIFRSLSIVSILDAVVLSLNAADSHFEPPVCLENVGRDSLSPIQCHRLWRPP